MNKMDVVAPVMDGLQRLATLHDVGVIATVGSPKQKGKDKYVGRDALFGSAALPHAKSLESFRAAKLAFDSKIPAART